MQRAKKTSEKEEGNWSNYASNASIFKKAITLSIPTSITKRLAMPYAKSALLTSGLCLSMTWRTLRKQKAKSPVTEMASGTLRFSSAAGIRRTFCSKTGKSALNMPSCLLAPPISSLTTYNSVVSMVGPRLAQYDSKGNS